LPKNQRPESIKKAAAEMAKAFIEKHMQPVLDTYGKVAKGYMVKKILTTRRSRQTSSQSLLGAPEKVVIEILLQSR